MFIYVYIYLHKCLHTFNFLHLQFVVFPGSFFYCLSALLTHLFFSLSSFHQLSPFFFFPYLSSSALSIASLMLLLISFDTSCTFPFHNSTLPNLVLKLSFCPLPTLLLPPPPFLLLSPFLYAV